MCSLTKINFCHSQSLKLCRAIFTSFTQTQQNNVNCRKQCSDNRQTENPFRIHQGCQINVQYCCTVTDRYSAAIWDNPQKNTCHIDMYSLARKHILLEICVSPLGIHNTSDMCFPPGKHISLEICVPLPGKCISLVICVPLPGKHISLVICVALPVNTNPL